MTPAKVNVLVALFAYSGNGGIPSISTAIAKWLVYLGIRLDKEPRVGQWWLNEICDTPITMTRNKAVRTARDLNCDFLLMIDSDMHPDLYMGRPGVEPFWEVAFDFAYERKLRGFPTVVAAPYCGPPCDAHGNGEANTYVFRWYQKEEGSPNLDLRFLSRTEAAALRGVQYMAALPTGLILYDMKAFDLMKPPYFKYEMRNEFAEEKISTEDVYNTREISMAGVAKGFGEVCYAAMDSWAGHIKIKTMGKPYALQSKEVSDTLREAWIDDEALYNARANNEPALPTMPSTSERGLIVTPRLVCGHPVKSVQHKTPTDQLETLRDIVKFFAEQHPDRFLRIVEVGSWVGESAVALASGLGPAGGVVYCVDTFEGSKSDLTGKMAKVISPDNIKEYFKKNTACMGDKIRVIEGDSLEVAEKFQDSQEIDVLFLDAGHTYDELKADIQAWSRHMARDGIMMGHDLSPQFPEVERAVRDCFGDDVQQYGDMPIWIYQCEVKQYEPSGESDAAARVDSSADIESVES